MNLGQVFRNVALKRLASVDLPKDESRHKGRSKQHEINGVDALRRFFGTSERLTASILWYYFADGAEPLHESGSLTFYDSRLNDRKRSAEWRGYYTGRFLGNASSGDVLVLARDVNERLYGLVFQQGSGWLRAAEALFRFDKDLQSGYVTYDSDALKERPLDFLQQRILDELGIEIAIPVTPSDETLVTDKFGLTFPGTKEMSSFARGLVKDAGMSDDDRLVHWIQREESLFFALERVIVGQKIELGFASVEQFLAYSISVQNRRKSRMGHALENHLEALFAMRGLRFSRGASTEGKNKPDFLFPGAAEYRDPGYSATELMMLAAKSTLKDRWRQVLTEAKRIPHKHLCTLDTAISSDQAAEISRASVTLVVPTELQAAYAMPLQRRLWTLTRFVEAALLKQRR